MKISEMKGSEVLPGKKDVDNTKYFGDDEQLSWDIGANETIDAYNSVDFYGEVVELANILISPSKSKKMNINFGVVNRYKAILLARAIISQMPKWVVLRKGK